MAIVIKKKSSPDGYCFIEKMTLQREKATNSSGGTNRNGLNEELSRKMIAMDPATASMEKIDIEKPM